MMKTILLSILVTSQAFAGLPPTTFKGQAESSKPTTFFLETPANQATTTAPVTRRIETGNQNQLVNPSFEHQTFSTGWTLTGTWGDGGGSARIQEGTKAAISQTAATAQTILRQNIAVNGLLFGSMGASWMASGYFMASTDDVNLCVGYDIGSGDVEANCALIPQDDGNLRDYKKVSVSLDVPSNGALQNLFIYLKKTSASTTDVFADNMFFGPFFGFVGLNLISTEMVDAGAITIGAVTSAPGKGGTPSPDVVRWGRRGDLGIFRYEFKQTVAGSAGSGHYLFSLPNGLRFDSNKISFYTGGTGTVGPQAASSGVAIGGASGTSNTAALTGEVIPYDATRFRIYFSQAASNAGYFGSGFAPLNVAATSFTADFIAPIEGWGVATVTDAIGLLPRETVYSAQIDGTVSPSTITRQTPGFLSGSCTRSGTGIYSCPLTSGLFLVAPVCDCSTEPGSGNNSECNLAGGVSTTTISIRINNNASAENNRFNIICQRSEGDYSRARSTYENVPMSQLQSIFGTATSVCSSTPCAMAEVYPSTINVSRSAAGSYSINVPAGMCASYLTCSPNAAREQTIRDGSPTSTTYPFNTANTSGTKTDAAFSFNCTCRKF